MATLRARGNTDLIAALRESIGGQGLKAIERVERLKGHRSKYGNERRALLRDLAAGKPVRIGGEDLRHALFLLDRPFPAGDADHFTVHPDGQVVPE